jgi:hypothetical protein
VVLQLCFQCQSQRPLQPVSLQQQFPLNSCWRRRQCNSGTMLRRYWRVMSHPGTTKFMQNI